MNNNSTENSTAKNPWFFDPGWNWFMWNIFVWLFPIICLQGAIANACSFYVIVSNRKSFPYVTRQYLTIITMSDFLILACKASTHYIGYMSLFVKDNAWGIYSSPRDWGLAWCIAYDFVTYYSGMGAPFFQLGLTVDRLIAVAAPMKAKIILTHKRSWILLAIITAMAMLLPAMMAGNDMWDPKQMTCVSRSEDFYYLVYAPIELYFGRVFLISSLVLGTISICLLLAWSNRVAQRMQMETASANEQQMQSNRDRQRSLLQISLMLVFINSIFFVTSMPWSIVQSIEPQIIMEIGLNAEIILIRHLNTVMYLNSALTWPMYFVGAKFRQAFIRIFVPQRLRACFRSANGLYKSQATTNSGIATQLRSISHVAN